MSAVVVLDLRLDEAAGSRRRRLAPEEIEALEYVMPLERPVLAHDAHPQVRHDKHSLQKGATGCGAKDADEDIAGRELSNVYPFPDDEHYPSQRLQAADADRYGGKTHWSMPRR